MPPCHGANTRENDAMKSPTFLQGQQPKEWMLCTLKVRPFPAVSLRFLLCSFGSHTLLHALLVGAADYGPTDATQPLISRKTQPPHDGPSQATSRKIVAAMVLFMMISLMIPIPTAMDNKFPSSAQSPRNTPSALTSVVVGRFNTRFRVPCA
jgi:hypothetical protein